ncbi:MAG: 30S ribosomal protein S17 [Oligoflexia bacterium]|nr:30S ribosomal protein S17 [Oligoflexia bacterium]
MVEQKNIQRSIRREKVGIVVSDKMHKTITVAVARKAMHSKYKKFINKTSKFKAHDEKEQAGMGDKVLIYETAPISKTKRWKLAKILEVADRSLE